MAVARMYNKSARMILDVGVDPKTSNVITRSYNFQLEHDATPDQIFNSIRALAELSKHSLWDIEQVETSSITQF